MQDKILIWRLKRGSDGAMRTIYERTRDDLLRLAVALLNDVSLGEDVVHDVFVNFVRSIPTFHLTGTLKGYLGTCVANRARNMNKAGQRTKAVRSDELADMSAVASGPDHWVACTEQFVKITQALSRLPYEQREAITLHIYGKMTFRAIAESRNLSIKTIQSQYRYGLDKLRSLLEKEVVL